MFSLFVSVPVLYFSFLLFPLNLSAMDIFKLLGGLITLSSRRRSERARRNNQPIDRPLQDDCQLLQLPIDIIVLFADHLPLHCLHTLAMTCYPLQTIIKHHYHIDYRSLVLHPSESLEYIYALSRYRLNRWPCSDCLKLHAVSYEDYPRQHHSNRDRQVKRNCPRLEHPRNARSFEGLESLLYSHVHIALKYTRASDPLGEARQSYLQALMKTRRGSYYHSASKDPSSKVYFTVWTRVVQGRFLQCTEYQSYNRGRDGSTWLYANIVRGCFCSHQRAHPSAWLSANPWLRSVAADANFFDSLQSEAMASCPYCATDLVLGRSFGAVIRVWKDHGPEVSPTHPCWRSHVSSAVKIRRGFQSARMLFESVDQNQGGQAIV